MLWANRMMYAINLFFKYIPVPFNIVCVNQYISFANIFLIPVVYFPVFIFLTHFVISMMFVCYHKTILRYESFNSSTNILYCGLRNNFCSYFAITLYSTKYHSFIIFPFQV